MSNRLILRAAQVRCKRRFRLLRLTREEWDHSPVACEFSRLPPQHSRRTV